MKNAVLLFVCYLLVSSLSGQKLFKIVSDNPDTLMVEPSNTKEEKQFTILLENVSDEEQLILWDSKLVMCGEQWDYSVCDLNQCYAPFVKECPEDLPNVMASGMQGPILFDLYDNGVDDRAVYQMRFWVKDHKAETLDSILLYYNSCVTALSDLPHIQPWAIKTNPVHSILELHPSAQWNQSDDYRLEVVSLGGTVLHTANSHGISAEGWMIPVGHIPSGIYVLQIVDIRNGNTARSTFVKI